jgi:hypothetical protein
MVFTETPASPARDEAFTSWPVLPATRVRNRLEGVEIRHAQQLAHVPFHVGGGVVPQPDPGIQTAIEDSRVAARQKAIPQSRRSPREGRSLVEAQRQQRQHRGAPREGLRYRFPHSQILASGEDESTWTGISVHLFLQVGDKFRRPLDFVENGTLADAGEKPAGILHGEAAMIRRFEGQVRQAGKESPTKGGLARLARPRERQHRILASAFAYQRSQAAGVPWCKRTGIFMDLQLDCIFMNSSPTARLPAQRQKPVQYT